MGLLEKFKNLFTEEVEEEVPVKREPVKREVKPIEMSTRVDRLEMLEKKKTEVVVEPEEPIKEEKFVFPVYFDDKDFEDLKKPEEKLPPKPTYIPPKSSYQAPNDAYQATKEPYKGAKPKIEEPPKKKFMPSPIISPVYGILDKNYQKEDIVSKKERPKSPLYHRSEPVSVDDIRKKAFGTLEDELETNLFGQNSILFKEEENIEENDTKEALDLLQELNFEEYDKHEQERTDSFDEIEHQMLEDSKIASPMDTDTALLAQQLEEQKKKLDELNEFINENKIPTTSSELTKAEKISELRAEMKKELEEGKEESLGDSDLFHLIDSMYEQKEEE